MKRGIEGCYGKYCIAWEAGFLAWTAAAVAKSEKDAMYDKL